ncbi:hypothetical protein AB9F26_16110 [Falsihalocynthiibacter sp. BN13B15]|uniref:hypothetical protein n=1 Tax=Falsihalocynthiibacter sp. BN13B15 TaxID=3240871 RepID=UPI003510CDBF
MRHKFTAIALFAALVSSQTAWAGTAFEERVDCPIGGIKTEIVSTFSCSYEQEFTMSLSQLSTCDFITHLPVCKTADFPIYKDFLLSEIPKLKAMVKTDWYKKSQKDSRYLRAYLVEKELGTLSEAEMFTLLQQGHMYDSARSYGNAKYYAAYREAANAFRKVATNEEKRYIYLTAAFARIRSGEPETAQELLDAAAKYKTPGDPRLTKYAALVEACIKKPNAKKCQPNYTFDLD